MSPDIEPPVHVTHPEHEKVSTGRGGAGNIRDRSQSKVRDQPEPHVRHAPHEGEFYSSGRGGAGNIRSRSQSKSPKEEKVWFDYFSSQFFFLFQCHTIRFSQLIPLPASHSHTIWDPAPRAPLKRP
ncbi:hypothetical protein BDM02DRAFT_3109108 [Thelephora ganbajun]|uniref:Uncharacterized protein n=1 Tax=Thelephora ganbajun TaxID=370292 RepID=A0ACB6ZSZ6_THEGA|nr:hypothetical protein BDM02DRAFT_3109108 [Thelephora ganbajun]